jgi:hypothetical protein
MAHTKQPGKIGKLSELTRRAGIARGDRTLGVGLGWYHSLVSRRMISQSSNRLSKNNVKSWRTSASDLIPRPLKFRIRYEKLLVKRSL